MTLPDPSAVRDALPARPPVDVLDPGEKFVRIFQPRRGAWSAQRFFGPLDDMRFDHHPPPCQLHDGYSVWYSSASLIGAVAEVYGRKKEIDRNSGQRIALAIVEKPLRVLDLLGVAARQVELTQEIASSTEYATTRAWAREFYQRYGDLHGIRWRGRPSGSVCVLLNNRTSMTHLSARHWPITAMEVWPRIARCARACRIDVV